MKRKKITAILLASLMGISAVPATTWAADSYKETEKAAFAKMIEEFGADYAKSLSEMDTEEVKGNAEIKVSLEDGGKAILGMLSPVDISWLADASISGNVSMSDKSMTEFMDVNVNGTKICTIEYYFDTENSEIYMRIPELSDGYIKMNMEQMTQEAVEERCLLNVLTFFYFFLSFNCDIQPVQIPEPEFVSFFSFFYFLFSGAI